MPTISFFPSICSNNQNMIVGVYITSTGQLMNFSVLKRLNHTIYKVQNSNSVPWKTITNSGHSPINFPAKIFSRRRAVWYAATCREGKMSQMYLYCFRLRQYISLTNSEIYFMPVESIHWGELGTWGWYYVIMRGISGSMVVACGRKKHVEVTDWIRALEKWG